MHFERLHSELLNSALMPPPFSQAGEGWLKAGALDAKRFLGGGTQKDCLYRS